MPHKIGAYLRVSTEEQAIAIEGSLDNQRYHLQSFVDLKNRQEKGWGKVFEFYVDDGYSAKDTKRPAYQRMMADLKRGKISLILIADLSRLSRNIHDFSTLLNELDRLKAKFLSIKEQFDTSSPAGKMMIFNLINLAQFEREQVSERVALGVHARGMRGLLNGGRPILGYDKRPERPGAYVVNPDEADQVRTIFKTFLKTGSRAKTVQQLNVLGIQPKVNGDGRTERKWTSQSLGYLLNSSAYIGKHEVNRRNKSADQSTLKPSARYQLVKAAWPAIIDEETFDQAHKLLEEAKRLERVRLKDASARTYLLTGLLRCGTCGAPLVGAVSHGEMSSHRYYVHTTTRKNQGCGVQRVSADAIEQTLLDHLKTGLSQAGYFKHLEARAAKVKDRTSIDRVKEVRRVKEKLADLETQASNIFLMQGQQSMSGDALKMLSEAVEKVAKEKRVLTEYLESLSDATERDESGGSDIQLIKQRMSDFMQGFKKANPNFKKRLLRRMIKQLVLTTEGLSIFYYLAEDDETPGHKMQLVRDEGAKDEKLDQFFLVGAAKAGTPNLSASRSDIGKDGDPSVSCTRDLQFRKPLLYLSELWGQYPSSIFEMAFVRIRNLHTLRANLQETTDLHSGMLEERRGSSFCFLCG